MIELTTIATAATTGDNFSGMYDWGLAVIHAFQAAGNPVLKVIAVFFTLLGEPLAYFLLLPVIFWCIDERRGFRIGFAVFVSAGINTAIKDFLRVPRPFYHDPSVKLADASGFSTPSGHSQGSATFWPLAANTGKEKKRWITLALTFLLPLCIGASRVYLGVHYPTDVLFGWALGAVIAAATLFIPKISALQKFVASISGIATTAGRSLKTYKLALAALVALVLNAVSGADSSMGGMVFGFAFGYIQLTEQPAKNSGPYGFSAATGSPAKKAARLLVGLAVLALLYLGLKMILPGETSEWYSLARFARFAIVGFWASWGAPTLFVKTGLAGPRTDE
jgi:membrane-associated phospholipid phosphatase